MHYAAALMLANCTSAHITHVKCAHERHDNTVCALPTPQQSATVTTPYMHNSTHTLSHAYLMLMMGMMGVMMMMRVMTVIMMMLQ